MRRPIRRIARTNNAAYGERVRTQIAGDGERVRPHETADGEQGSVTLETALIMPVFLLLVFFLLFLIQTSIIAMSLHGALSQTARMAAASWYPISLMQEERSSSGQQPSSTSTSDLPAKWDETRDMLGEFADWLPAPLNDWAESLADGTWSVENEAARLAFQQIAIRLADSRVLDPERFRMTSVGLPEQGNPAAAFLTLEAEYRLPFRVPFTGTPVVIRATARERAWVGGSPSRAAADDGEADGLHVTFISLEPNPVRPGRKATLILRTTPGAVLDLSVFYKSGQSQAKHLGSAAADESGLVSWTWHVSGNTTSGEWIWEVKGNGGSFSRPFRIERLNDKGADYR